MDREDHSFSRQAFSAETFAPGTPAPRPSAMPEQSLTPWTPRRLARALAGWVMAQTYLPEAAKTDRHA